MTMNVFMFYLLSGIILIFSILTVTSKRVLRATVYLLFVLVATSGLYFLLKYDFLAAVQLTLYAGGIVVLIIFSILLTHQISHKLETPPLKKWLSGISVFIVGIAMTLGILLNVPFTISTIQGVNVDMTLIGTQLLSTEKNGFVLPFELISILLLAGMIVAIVIARKEKFEEIKK